MSIRILSVLSNLTCIHGYVDIDLFEQTTLKFPNLTRLQLAIFQWEPHFLENLAVQCPNLKILSLRFDSRPVVIPERNPSAQFSHLLALKLRALPDQMDKSILFSYFPNVVEVVVDNVSEEPIPPSAYDSFGESLPKTVKFLTWGNGSARTIKLMLKSVQLTVLRVGTGLEANVFSEEVHFPHQNTKHLFVVADTAYIIDGRICFDTREHAPRPLMFRCEFLSI